MALTPEQTEHFAQLHTELLRFAEKELQSVLPPVSRAEEDDHHVAERLVETVCRHILDEQKLDYSETDDLLRLYPLTADSLNLSPSQHTEQVFRRILGGCQTVVEGLGAMQDRHSDADGTETAGVRPASRHAELAVNLAGTMATFLLATWEAKHK